MLGWEILISKKVQGSDKDLLIASWVTSTGGTRWIPIVKDSLEYESKGKKSGPYRVHEGSRSLTLDPLLERGSKKKAL
jgi:hypothetical protein